MSITAEKIKAALSEFLFNDPLMNGVPHGLRANFGQRLELAILPLLQQGEPEGFVRVPKAALDWLNGSGPDHEGKWFGEVEDALPQSKHPRKYFWRSHFRKICNAITGKPTFYTYNKSQRALVASPSPLPPAPGAETGLEPKGCPTPGACSCPASSSRQAVLEEARDALDQARDCIRGETPEDMSLEDAEHDTFCKVVDALRSVEAALASTPPAEGETK